jgi:hypothetical protein
MVNKYLYIKFKYIICKLNNEKWRHNLIMNLKNIFAQKKHLKKYLKIKYISKVFKDKIYIKSI